MKGATYLNAQANTYRHVTDNDQEIVVTGTCGKREGKITREVHITCSPRVAQPALAVSHEATPSL